MGDNTRVVVIGAGPAGAAAAATVAQYGLAVTVVDEHEIADSHPAQTASNLTHRPNTLVWGLFPDNQVALYADERAESVAAAAVVLATGGHERAVAFPGWTMPGILNIGELRGLARKLGGLTGERVLIAGTGPLLLLAAAEVLENGGNVAALVEARPSVAPLELVRTFAGTAAFSNGESPEEMLRRRGVPIHLQSTILSAHGDGRLASAVVTQLRPNDQHDPSATVQIDCDTLCSHAGFSAALELAQMVDCAVEYNVDAGGWHVHHDGEMRSSRAGVYVAGRVAGYAGHDIAEASGRLAGLAVAHDLGAISAGEFAEAATHEQDKLDSLRLASCQINTYSAMESELSSTITPDTLLCPDEGVRAADVDLALSLGARTFNDIKRRTRAGMGESQARICGPLISAYVARQTGARVESVGLMTARPPIRPIPLSAVAELGQRLTED